MIHKKDQALLITIIMIPAERQRAIIALLGLERVISFDRLADQLAVSQMTIRRDVATLEKKGKVVSVSGGVQLSEILENEPSREIKYSLNQHEKVAIGKFAASLIQPGTTVYLDAGTTTFEIAKIIAPKSDLLVITSDFDITSFLMTNSKCELYHTGGRVFREDQSSVGEKVAQMLGSVNFDLAFISSSSWDHRGISTPCADKILVKQAIVRAARTNVLVSDSSKFGKIGTFNALALDSFDRVITDEGLSDINCSEIRASGIQLDLVQVYPHSESEH